MHIMIDLETMGNRPQAPIVAIGAVWFDEEKTYNEFYANVNLENAVNHGAVIDASTVAWWMRQSGDARNALDLEGGLSVGDALVLFTKFVKTYELDGIWGNGASFDNTILSESYRRIGVEPPWRFWQDRCFRTMKALYPEVQFDRLGVHHNALDDAKTQAKHLQAIWRHVNGL